MSDLGKGATGAKPLDGATGAPATSRPSGTTGAPSTSSAATRRISLSDMRRSVLACMEQGHLQPPFVSDVIALIDLAEIVKERRTRFNVKPYPGDWHKKSSEEEAIDALLEPFDA